MPAELVAEVGTSEGSVLHVVRKHGRVLIADNATAMRVEDAQSFRDVLLSAADAENGGVSGARLIGTIGQGHVLRWPYHVTVTEHPDRHSGWSMNTEQARELGEALLNAARSAHAA